QHPRGVITLDAYDQVAVLGIALERDLGGGALRLEIVHVRIIVIFHDAAVGLANLAPQAGLPHLTSGKTHLDDLFLLGCHDCSLTARPTPSADDPCFETLAGEANEVDGVQCSVCLAASQLAALRRRACRSCSALLPHPPFYNDLSGCHF